MDLKRGPSPTKSEKEAIRIEILRTINERAKTAWLRRPSTATTYEDHYNDKTPDVVEPTMSRPTSSGRRHNPHPPAIFLTTRLHSVPGYHNADVTLGKNIYQVDASQNASEQARRAYHRAKYTSRPRTAAFLPYRDTEDNNLKPGSKAATPVARSQSACEVQVGSLVRWMRGAGADERDFINRVLGRSEHRVPASRRRAVSAHHTGRRDRGDFLIHPEYPPRIPHHRLNGLDPL